jgi:phage-related protein
MANILFGGTALTSAGAYKVTIIDDARSGVPVRGDNPEIPQREGRIHVGKYFEQRRMSIGMVIEGTTSASYESNLDAMKLLLSRRSRQVLSEVMASGGTRSAYAEVIGDLNITQVAPYACKASVDFLLADPFMRSSALTTVTSTIIAADHTFTVANPGTTQDRSAVITLTGGSSGLYYPKITNTTNGIYCGYSGNIASSVPVVFNCAAWTVTESGATALVNAYHSGDSYFMVLEPGANTIRVEASAYTGATIKFEFYAPYL